MKVKEILKKYNIKPRKSLGQNFLIDNNKINKIVEYANISEDDLVIEIGPGVGSLTVKIIEKCGFFLAIELDKNMILVLEDLLVNYENKYKILNKDVLKVDIDDYILEYRDKYKSIKLIGNLPYYITTPIVMKILESSKSIDSLIIMVQKEVADRIVASENTKDYSSLSVAVQYYSNPKIIMKVPPGCFWPEPDVMSSIVKLDISKDNKYNINDKDCFFGIVKAAFEQRRKTLLNALYNSKKFNFKKNEILEMIKLQGLDENVRGENLSIMQFANLSNAFFEKNK